MKDLTIVIPTFGRPNQTTLETLPAKLLRRVMVVAPKKDLKDLKRNYGHLKIEIVEYPLQEGNIEQKRAWILNSLVKTPKFIMLDDDITAWKTWIDRKGKSTCKREGSSTVKATEKDIIKGFQTYCDMLDIYHHGGFVRGYTARTARVNENGIMYAIKYQVAWGGRTKTFKKKIEFGKTILLGDNEWNFQLLSQGYESFFIAWLHFEHEYDKNGGCSVVRKKLFSKVLKDFNYRWPDFCRLRESNGKLDITLYCKKLLKMSVNTNRNQ